MPPKIDQLANEAMNLSASERAELAERLWLSIMDDEQTQIECAWIEEAERRIDDLNAGRAQVVPAESALSAATEAIQRLRR